MKEIKTLLIAVPVIIIIMGYSCISGYDMAFSEKPIINTGSSGSSNPTDRLDFMFGTVDEDNKIVAWEDSLTMYNAAEEMEELMGQEQDLFHALEYQEEEVALRLEMLPKDAEITSISIESSNPELLKITKNKTIYDYKMQMLGVGDVQVDIKIHANDNVVSKTYKIRIREILTLVVYVDRFWKYPSRNKLRIYCSDLPGNVKAMAMTIRDSLEVDAECYWKDVENGIDSYQRSEITHKFRTVTKDKAFRKNKRCLFRDFSEVSDRYIEGSDYINDTTIVTRYYYYTPITTRLFLDICSNNPYLYFNLIVKENKILSSDKDISHIAEEVNANDPEAQEHCAVSFCFGMTAEEEQKMRDELNGKLDGISEDGEDPYSYEMFENMSQEEIEEFIKNMK